MGIHKKTEPISTFIGPDHRFGHLARLGLPNPSSLPDLPIPREQGDPNDDQSPFIN